MLGQSEINLNTMKMIAGILIFLVILLIFFSSVPLARYLERKKKNALYYAVSQMMFLVSATFSTIGVISVIETGEKTFTYFLGIFGMNIGITLASLFLFLFYADIMGNVEKQRTIALVFGILLVIFEFLPQNDWFNPNPEGFSLKYISLMLQTIYCCVIYLTLAKQFNFLSKRIEAQAKDFKFMSNGNIMLAVFFVFMLLRAPFGDAEWFLPIQIFTWAIEISGIMLIFIGFMRPTLKRKD